MSVRLHAKPKKPIKNNHPFVLITGDGSSLREDLAKFFAMTPGILASCCDFYAIGRSYQVYPPGMKMDHWGSVDGDPCMNWAENLPSDKIHEGTLRHTMGEVRGFDVDWDIEGSPYDLDKALWHGSSSLFAVLTCLEMGYKRIILAGCPLDAKGHWYFPKTTGPMWDGQSYRVWLDFAARPEAKRVKSFSGYTALMLGVPE